MNKCLLFLLSFSYFIHSSAIDYQNWMKELPDELKLCYSSIPGTHDSGTKGFSFSGETQKLSIKEQLNAGVRAFDIRAGVYNSSTLRIYHSEYLCGDESMEQIFDTFTGFLTEHPSECLFIILKRECGDESTWKSLMAGCLEKYKSFFVDLKRGQNIGQTRGKIFMMSRDKYATTPFGSYFLSGWKDNATSDNYIKGSGSYQMPVRIQDIYDAEDKIADKKTDIVKLLDECAKKKSTYTFFINHTSGYTATTIWDNRYVADCASICNPIVINHLAEINGPAGVIMTDFAGVDQVSSGGKTYDVNGKKLVDAVINHCYRIAEILHPAAIETPSTEISSSTAYDIQGKQIVLGSYHGIYVINGKKYFRK